MAVSKLVAATCLGAFALVAACGSGHPPAASQGSSGGTAVAGGGDAGADDTKPPGCGTAADGTQCGCVDVPLFVDPPNMYFVLDHSGSMIWNGKWDSVRVTMANLVRQIGQRANFGATLFPSTSSSADQCASGNEVLALRQGDPPSTKDGPTTTALLKATNVYPSGGTPTAATLRDLLGRVKSFSGKTFIILATDGGPNCNEQTTCEASSCTLNLDNAAGCPPAGPSCCDGQGAGSCLDTLPTTNAVKALAQSGFPVYVIGIPGSAPYATLLDDLAVAGGTAQAASPKYYRVDGSGSDDLLAALRKVAAKIVATCTFQLKEPPQDPGLVNVYLDEKVLPQDPANGWKIEGATVTLLGDACARVTNGDVLDVRIIAGCPSVIH